MTMKLTKALFLFLVFSLIFFLLSNLVLYLGPTREAIISGKFVLVFGVYAEYIVGPRPSAYRVLELFRISRNVILVGGLFVLIINVIVKALIRRWRPLKTLISFHIPLCLIISPLHSVEVSSTFVQQHIPQVLDNHALLNICGFKYF